MTRRQALAALPLLAAPLAAAAQQPAAGLPSPPPSAAPPPFPAAPPRGAPAPPLALPAGMSPLPHGAYRVSFRAGEQALPAGVAPALNEIGRRLAATPAGFGRITVEAQASGPRDDASAARRIALARAQAVRAALVAGGLAETRVDVRALGRTNAALDAADILPPPPPRSGGSAEAPRSGGSAEPPRGGQTR